jgi:hypothetical protein
VEEPVKQNPDDASEATVLEWRVHLFRSERPYRSVIAVSAVVTALAGGWVFIQDPFVLTAYFIILFFALGEFFFPVKYRITNKGVYKFAWIGPRFMDWKRIKRAYKNEFGVKLSIFSEPSPFESFRGLFIRFGENRDEVVSTVRRLVPGRSAGNAGA